MHRHQRDAVRVVFFSGHVHVREQRNVLQIVAERHQRRFVAIVLRFLNQFVHISCDRIDQLLNVRGARHSFHAGVRFVHRIDAGLIRNSFCKRGSVLTGDRLNEFINKKAEIAQFTHHRFTQHGNQFFGEHGLEQAESALTGKTLQGGDSRLPYPSRRFIHRPAETLVVQGVDGQLEIGH